jgi:hypothetical protein
MSLLQPLQLKSGPKFSSHVKTPRFTYNITSKDVEFRDFYDLASLETEEELCCNFVATRLSKDTSHSAHGKPRNLRSSKCPGRHNNSITTVTPDQGYVSTDSNSEPQKGSASSDEAETQLETSNELITEASPYIQQPTIPPPCQRWKEPVTPTRLTAKSITHNSPQANGKSKEVRANTTR